MKLALIFLDDDRAGIRPTRRLLLGVLKYPVAYSEYGQAARGIKPPKCFYDDDMDLVAKALNIFPEKDVEQFRSLDDNQKTKYKGFDCSIMELADDIAYGVHDLEDGIGRGILKRDQVEVDIRKGFKDANVTEIREVSIDVLIDKLFSPDACARKHAISLLVGYFIINIEVRRQDIFENPFLDLKATVPTATRSLLDHFAKELTFKSIVGRREVQTLEYKGEKIIRELFQAFADRPLLLVGSNALDPFNSGASEILSCAENSKKHWTEINDIEKNHVARAICDFIAGMTNPYAQKISPSA
jgi:dGTPase